MKKIQPLLLAFLISTLFFSFLQVAGMQSDSYKLVSTGGRVDYPPPPEPDGDYPPTKLWSDDSYWYMKIKQNPKLHPNSAQMANWLVTQENHLKYPTINWKSFSNTVYECYEDTPVYRILDTDSNAYFNVPFPDPYPIRIPSDTDASVTIIDWYRAIVWDFWNVKAVGGSYTVGDSYGYDIGGSGITPMGVWASGGSSTPTVAYLIRPEEIEAGVINHVLGCCMYRGKKDVKVYPPAATTDASKNSPSSDTWAIPQGARIQLDPSLDLDSLGLSSTAKIIAKCMQDYGIVFVESGGGWVLYAEHDLTADWNPPQMSGGLLSKIGSLVTSSYNPWRIIDYTEYPPEDDLSEYE